MLNVPWGWEIFLDAMKIHIGVNAMISPEMEKTQQLMECILATIEKHWVNIVISMRNAKLQSNLSKM
jgi:hypothetical protein